MPQSGLTRNIFVHDAYVAPLSDPILVGGMYQFGHTTADELYFCLELCFREPRAREFQLLAADGVLLRRDAAIVRTGSYTVVSRGILPPGKGG